MRLKPTPQAGGRAAHGLAFVLLMGFALQVPALRTWPWVWLAPLAAYMVLVACLPQLRRSCRWPRAGRLSAAGVGATMGVMAVTACVLVAFHVIAKPDVGGYWAALPFHALGSVIVTGIVFTVTNATLEELVFRGVLFDAFHSQWGVGVTLTATSVLFGLGHLHGYPPGAIGACLAALFGFAVGALRLWTGGLALPIVAHMGADATICSILVCSGAP